MTVARHSGVHRAAPLIIFAAWVAGWWFGALLAGLLTPMLARLFADTPYDAIAIVSIAASIGLAVVLATLRLRTTGSVLRQHVWQSSLFYLVTAAGIVLFFAAGGAASGHTSAVPLMFSLISMIGAGLNGATLAIARRRLDAPATADVL